MPYAPEKDNGVGTASLNDKSFGQKEAGSEVNRSRSNVTADIQGRSVPETEFELIDTTKLRVRTDNYLN